MKLTYIYTLGLLCLLGWSDALAKSNSSTTSCRCANGGFELYGGANSASKFYGCVYGRVSGRQNLWTSVKNVVGSNGQVTRVYKIHYYDANGDIKTDSHTFNHFPPLLSISADCGVTRTPIHLGDLMFNYDKIGTGDEFVCGNNISSTNGQVNASVSGCTGCGSGTKFILNAAKNGGNIISLTAKTIGVLGLTLATGVAIYKTGGAAAPVASVFYNKGMIVVSAGSLVLGNAIGDYISQAASNYDQWFCNTSIQRQTSFYTGTTKPTAMGVQPNPAGALSTLHLRLPKANDLNIEIFDQQGRHHKTVVMGQHFAKGMNQIPLQVQDLPAGIYLIKVTGGQGLQLTHRLVKK